MKLELQYSTLRWRRQRTQLNDTKRDTKAHLGDAEEDPDDGLDHVEGGCTPVGLGHKIQQNRERPRRHQGLAAALRHICHQLCQKDTHQE